MRYAIVIEKAARNYSAYVPDVPGCVATGKTVADTLRAIREALEFHLEGMSEDGLPIPDPSSVVEYVEVRLPAADSSTAARPARRRAS
jgi:predicted RNase H-like HicB family nuclease